MTLARTFTAVLVLLGVLVTGRAAAYPSMIRHGYTHCASCHVDPSGGGLLEPYGRAQQQLLLPNHDGRDPAELEPSAERLFGVIQAPAWLNAGLSFRGGALHVGSRDAPPVVPLVMAADVRAAVTVGPFRASGTLGFSPRGARLAALTDQPSNNLVSREHWLGLQLLEGAVQVRAGRINVPFGLRNQEHVAWVRSQTRSDLVSAQQYGLAVAYNQDMFRAEVMGIAGNFLLRLPEYREVGYAGSFDAALTPHLALGVSSLLTRAHRDLEDSAPQTLRQAHGLFARWSPATPWVFTVEVDALVKSSLVAPAALGLVTFAQTDWEPLGGLHLYATAETLTRAGRSSYGGWLSGGWFFAAFGELRVDTILRQEATPTGSERKLMVLGQLHLSM